MADDAKSKRIKVEEVKDVDEDQTEKVTEPEVAEKSVETPKSSVSPNEENVIEEIEPKVESSETESEDAKKADSPASEAEKKISSFSLADVKKSDTSVKTAKEEEPLDLTSTARTENAEEEPEDKSSSAPETEKAKDWLSDVKPEETMTDEKEGGGKKKFFVILLILVILGGVIAGGVYYYQTNMANISESTSEPTPVVEEPTPTPNATEASNSAEIDYSKYSVSVLNGSGIVGEAGKAAALLDDFEFKSVDTGNAGSYDYTKTEVATKEDVPTALYDEIQTALEENYVITKADKSLDEEYAYDIEIIVGTETN
jgi:hypothetical protein